MYVTRAARSPLCRQTATQLSKSAASFGQSYGASATPALQLAGHTSRPFSSTSRTSLRDYFPEPEHGRKIFKTEAAWPHPRYVPPHLFSEYANNSIATMQRL